LLPQQTTPTNANAAVTETTFFDGEGEEQDNDDELLEADLSTNFTNESLNNLTQRLDRRQPEEGGGEWTAATSVRSSQLDLRLVGAAAADTGPGNMAYLVFIILAMFSIILDLFNTIWSLTASKVSRGERESVCVIDIA